MAEIKQDFVGMRAGIAAIDNAWVGIDTSIANTISTSNQMLAGWQGTAADVWAEIRDDWEVAIRRANERLKVLEGTLKKILDDQMQKEDDRAQKTKQADFGTKQKG
ncbi:hypothetical protein [Streptomyces sp. NPDC056632]|uniref:hypothetical protein n=1 Tax=Streptomyces sp. NPDC056632 TaxID=3345884 RepID=UPI00368F7DB5